MTRSASHTVSAEGGEAPAFHVAFDPFPPDWAIERALELGFTGTRLEDVKRHGAGHAAHIAFAHYIAQHEEPPADPLLIEARELIASMEHPAFGDKIAEVMAGKHDAEPLVDVTLAALKRGIELGRQP